MNMVSCRNYKKILARLGLSLEMLLTFWWVFISSSQSQESVLPRTKLLCLSPRIVKRVGVGSLLALTSCCGQQPKKAFADSICYGLLNATGGINGAEFLRAFVDATINKCLCYSSYFKFMSL